MKIRSVRWETKKSHSKEILPDYSCKETLHLYPFCCQMWLIHTLQLVCFPTKGQWGSQQIQHFELWTLLHLTKEKYRAGHNDTSKFKSLKLPDVGSLVPHLTDKENLQVRPGMY